MAVVRRPVDRVIVKGAPENPRKWKPELTPKRLEIDERENRDMTVFRKCHFNAFYLIARCLRLYQTHVGSILSFLNCPNQNSRYKKGTLTWPQYIKGGVHISIYQRWPFLWRTKLPKAAWIFIKTSSLMTFFTFHIETLSVKSLNDFNYE
mgnify:CR=1 FL=1